MAETLDKEILVETDIEIRDQNQATEEEKNQQNTAQIATSDREYKFGQKWKL